MRGLLLGETYVEAGRELVLERAANPPFDDGGIRVRGQLSCRAVDQSRIESRFERDRLDLFERQAGPASGWGFRGRAQFGRPVEDEGELSIAVAALLLVRHESPLCL